MPSFLSYPGVYVEELPSGVRTITGVPTSVTAFVGRARQGPTDAAYEITSYAEFERVFGGLWAQSPMSFAVRDFYLNGGNRAVIVRLASPSFSSAQARRDAEKPGREAAEQVLKAAEAAANGAAAKTAAKAKRDAIVGAAASKEAEKAAAEKAFLAISALKDDAAPEAIKAVVADSRAVASQSTVRSIDIGPLRFDARWPGSWAANLRVTVERPHDTKGTAPASAIAAAKSLGVDVLDLFTINVIDESPGGAAETFANVTVKDSVRRVDKVLEHESQLITWAGESLTDTAPDLAVALPAPTAGATDYKGRRGDAVVEARQALRAEKAKKDANPATVQTLQQALDTAVAHVSASVTDGGDIGFDEFLPPNGAVDRRGLHSLEQLFTRGGIFNLLCIPPPQGQDIASNVLAAAAELCERRRAMLIVDPPKDWKSVTTARNDFGTDAQNLPRTRNAAVFFPRVCQLNPLAQNRPEEFAPCGIVTGIFARTDAQRGVWKAPAGLDAALSGVQTLAVEMTDEENGLLNPLGINCLRKFPIFGHVLWGARTLRGADDYADEYKYTAVRRTALFIEESLFRGLKWVVFEPNDEPLWAQIRLNVGAFMNNLFRQGAFQGASAREAYFVKCDATTTTQNDINLGVVNVHVGFAPLKPAEFVVIKLQQIAGQIES